MLLGELSADFEVHADSGRLSVVALACLGGFGGGSGPSKIKERRGLIGGGLRSPRQPTFDTRSEASDSDLDKIEVRFSFESECTVRGRGVGRKDADAIPSNAALRNET